jgi:hypothetical protein
MTTADALMLVLRLANEAAGRRPPHNRTAEQWSAAIHAIDIVTDIVLPHYQPEPIDLSKPKS